MENEVARKAGVFTGKPSAADLDTHANELRTKQATAAEATAKATVVPEEQLIGGPLTASPAVGASTSPAVGNVDGNIAARLAAIESRLSVVESTSVVTPEELQTAEATLREEHEALKKQHTDLLAKLDAAGIVREPVILPPKTKTTAEPETAADAEK